MICRPLLLATDLDRTLLPNGPQPESPQARAYFRKLVSLPEVTLIYVTGRDSALVREAIAYYDLPPPAHVIADVGSTIYRCHASAWHPWTEWSQHISAHWPSPAIIAQRLADFPALHLQETTRQTPYKLSYTASLDTLSPALLAAIQTTLEAAGIAANLIGSVDVMAHRGLLDVLPMRASKYHALIFLAQHLGIPQDDIIFAGDSGNDLPVLISPIAAILVRNADPEIWHTAQKQLTNPASLYWACGGFKDMNGHYAAGIVEGVAHYRPDLITLLED